MRLLRFSALLLAGCAAEHGEQQASSRDSAGVEIRELDASAAAPTRRLGDEPVVSIGDIDSGPDSQFVDIAGAVLLSDGRIVVADRGLNTVRYFDANGRLVTSIGGPGAGPGEFRALQAVGRFAGDSIYALDRRLLRITVMDESGQAAFFVPLPMYFASAYPLGDRRWIAATAEGYFGGSLDQQAQPGLTRFPAPILVLSPDGTVADTLASPPGQELAYIRMGERMGGVPGAFGRVLSLAVRGQRVHVATGAMHGYDVYDPDRGLIQSTRLTSDLDLSIRATDIAAFQSTILREIPDSAARAAFSEMLKTAATPRTKAPVSRILIDDTGVLWLSEYENPYFNNGVWHLVDPQGGYRGRVTAPTSLLIQDVHGSRVVGIWRDDLGVQSVRVYELDADR
jgi:hypothetical protein